MSYQYDHATDRVRGHSGLSGAHGPQFVQWEMDELELGARVAYALDEPDQWWWELFDSPSCDPERGDPATSEREQIMATEEEKALTREVKGAQAAAHEAVDGPAARARAARMFEDDLLTEAERQARNARQRGRGK